MSPPLAACMKSALRQARVRRGLAQKELAQRLGVSANAVEGWEKPSGKPPSFEHYHMAAIVMEAPEMLDALHGALGAKWRCRPSTDREAELERKLEQLRQLHTEAGELLNG